MKALSLCILALVVLCGMAPAVCAIDNSQGKWALHFAGPHNAKLNTCSFDIGDCQNIVTEGPAGPGHFDVYVIACDVARIQSTRFGLRCDGAFYFYGWTNCADLELPTSGWPWCEEGNRLSWIAGQDGPYVNLGILDIYVYGDARLWTRSDPRVGFAEWCDDSEPSPSCFTTTDLGAFGYVEFGSPEPPQGSISGTKFFDANSNGIRDAGEAGLSGWMIQLNPGSRDTLTDGYGQYCFSDLDPNTYTVTEVLKPNWIQTYPPGPGTHVVDVSLGEWVTGIDFGNRYECTVNCRTWYVKVDGTGDAPTIQAGIDSAAAGDTVLVAAGTYAGGGNKNLDFRGKDLVLCSEAGPEATVIDCEEAGRGLHFYSGESPAAVVDGFTIRNGSALMGGGIVCEWFTSPRITDCTFLGNSATYGGAMACGSDASLTIVDCTFSGNSAGWGAGLWCEPFSCATLTGCTFSGNSASVIGGVIYCHAAFLTLTGCTFSGNSADREGGVMCFCYCSPTLTGCTFSQNSARYGGGISCLESSPTLTNCTFSDNSAYLGAGVCCDDWRSSPTLQNTIIALSNQGGAIYCSEGSNPVLSCCDIYGNAGGDWVGCIADQHGFNGNISEDPLFCDAESGNYRLKEGSPCAPANSPPDCGLIGALPVGCYASISGTKFNDINGNGTRETWEPGLSKWMISLNPGGLATLTDGNGDFSFNGLEANTYTVTEVLKPNWVQTCPPLPGSYVVELSPMQWVSGRDFGNSKFSDFRDLSVSVAGGRARPGFQKAYGISYQNKGTLTVNATLTLTLPPEVSHVESSEGGTYSTQMHNVIWDIGSLEPGFIGWLWTKVQLPATLPLGTALTSTAQITPIGNDITPDDNKADESQVVTGAFDPNDKQVTPEGFILCSDTLTYQVNFQNVGTDTAFNIVVRDTLDMNLDITTLMNGASLHPNVFQIAGRELSWTFNNIQLPDSNVNEPGSHGFVTFKVLPMSDLPVGTEIENHAGVYFDFNPPVITNAVLNTIIEALPASVDVDPNTLNLRSEGKYATTYIELPEGYDPWDIDVGTVLFNGALPAVAAPTAVADYDSDGVADRMVKFNRSGVIGLLSGSGGSRWWLEERGGDTAPLRHGEEIEVTVSGELEDGTPFMGTDIIRVINPGGDSDGALALEVYPSPVDEMAMISFELPVKGPVKLCIYDAAGRLVRRLLEGQRAAGRHEVRWDRRTDSGRQVSAGVYFVRLERHGGAIVQKVLVVR